MRKQLIVGLTAKVIKNTSNLPIQIGKEYQVEKIFFKNYNSANVKITGVDVFVNAMNLEFYHDKKKVNICESALFNPYIEWDEPMIKYIKEEKNERL